MIEDETEDTETETGEKTRILCANLDRSIELSTPTVSPAVEIATPEWSWKEYQPSFVAAPDDLLPLYPDHIEDDDPLFQWREAQLAYPSYNPQSPSYSTFMCIRLFA
jgi:hypothetical protein